MADKHWVVKWQSSPLIERPLYRHFEDVGDAEAYVARLKRADPEVDAEIYMAVRIDINTASHSELQRILHIGTVRAAELINLRPFCCVDDMERVPSIAASRLADIKAQGLACVDPANSGITYPCRHEWSGVSSSEGLAHLP